MTRSLAAVPSVGEVEHACAQFLTLFREVHSFAYDAGGQSNVRRSQTNDPTGDVAVNGLSGGKAVDEVQGHADAINRLGAREALVNAALHLDWAVARLNLALRMERRLSDVTKLQTWDDDDAEDVSEEYAARKRRGQAHARSVGA